MADADKNNASVNANESASIDDELTSALNGIAEILPQNGRGASAEPESDDADDDTAGESTDVEENDADDDEGDGAGETDDDSEDGEADADSQATADANKAGEGKPSQEPIKPAIPSKEERVRARYLAAVEKYAKENGFHSVAEMIAEPGEDEADAKKRLEADELTIEEKAALYDREHAMSEEERREADGKKFFDGLLAEIHEAYPETKDVVKTPKDLDDEETFRLLIMSGKKSAVEAFRMTNGSKIRRTAPPPSGKGHLQPDVHSKTKGSATSMSAEEITTLRNLFPGMKDREIEQLRRKVNS